MHAWAMYRCNIWVACFLFSIVFVRERRVMNRTMVFFQVICVILFIILVLYNLKGSPIDMFFGHVWERFTVPSVPSEVWNTEITSTNIYDKNPSLMCDTLRYASKFLGDGNDTLQIRYCIETAMNRYDDYHDRHLRIVEDLFGNMDMYIQTIEKETTNMTTIRKDIERALFNFKAGRKVQGPVFALVSQAPYYVDNGQQLIYHQPFNREQYRYAPTLHDKSALRPTGVQVAVHLCFVMYDNNKTLITLTSDEERQQHINDTYTENSVRTLVGNLMKDPSNKYSTQEKLDAELQRHMKSTLVQLDGARFKDHLKSRLAPIKNLKSNSNMCKIHCIGDTGLLCGCMNQNEPYMSRCMGKKNPYDSQNTDYHDYIVFYRVNEHANKLKRYFTGLYYEDVAL